MKMFEVFMLKPEHNETEFRGYAEQKSVKRTNYRRVYEGVIPADKKGVIEKLEYIFELLNINHPADYNNRSLSVSDVVCIDEGVYFCDDFGWQKIEGFFPARHTAEWWDVAIEDGEPYACI